MSYVSTDIKKIIAEIIETKRKGGVKNIYFVGCGGSLGSALSGKDIYGKRRRRYFVQHGSTVTSLFIVHRRISEKTQSYVWHVIKEIHLRRFRRQNSEKKKAPQLLSLHGLKNLRSLSSEITLFVIHLMQVWITLRETSIMQEKKHSARCS